MNNPIRNFLTFTAISEEGTKLTGFVVPTNGKQLVALLEAACRQQFTEVYYSHGRREVERKRRV